MPSQLTLTLPHSADNPRNSEGAFVSLADGRVLFAKNDYSGLDSRAIAIFFLSDDAGRTWRESKDWCALPVRSGSACKSLVWWN